MNTSGRHLRVFLCWVAVGLAHPAGPGSGIPPREEAEAEFFARWLEQEVRYLVTDEERSVFEALQTSAEKERFIEQFWHRRDPDPRTPANEFREEHYRRIAFANERFQSGTSGWKTDRGRIYILHGPPDERESYPSGGRYLRGPREGGGASSSFPFERWRYRFIPGVGSDIELEFVDASWAGEYRLAAGRDEKDALLRVPNAGLNRAERLGLARKMDRVHYQPGMRGVSLWAGETAGESPFARYERQVQVMAPPAEDDLWERVQVSLSYQQFQYPLRTDYFALKEGRSLVAITLGLPSRDFLFVRERDRRTARVGVQGRVTDVGHRLIQEFEEEILLALEEGEAPGDRASRSLYQRLLTLPQGTRYKLDLVIRDLHSGRVGTVRTGVQAALHQGRELAASSLVLSDLIQPLPRAPAGETMFVLGDIKVRPSLDNRFQLVNPLGLYLQLYNLGIDQTDHRPWLETRYRIWRQDQVVLEVAGGPGEGLRLYPDGRAALIKALPSGMLLPGRYQLEVQLVDRVRGASLHLRQEFELAHDDPPGLPGERERSGDTGAPAGLGPGQGSKDRIPSR